MNKCLLIVDVQEGFINYSTKHIPKSVEEIQKHYKYIYATRFFNEKNSFYRQLIKWDRFEKNSDDFSLAFKPIDKVKIIDKNIYSCVNAKFINNLNKNKIDKVDLCGIDTDICVTKCAVDLFESGIVPRILSKYCASHAGVVAHDNAIKTLERFIGRDQIV
jgi:nicotinamidase-related amidase